MRQIENSTIVNLNPSILVTVNYEWTILTTEWQGSSYWISKKNTKGSAVTTITLKGKCMIINRLKVGGWKKIYCVHS